MYLWLIHVDVWQKPTQYCKTIILQLKINNFFKKLKKKRKQKIKMHSSGVFQMGHPKSWLIFVTRMLYYILLRVVHKLGL